MPNLCPGVLVRYCKLISRAFTRVALSTLLTLYVLAPANQLLLCAANILASRSLLPRLLAFQIFHPLLGLSKAKKPSRLVGMGCRDKNGYRQHGHLVRISHMRGSASTSLKPVLNLE